MMFIRSKVVSLVAAFSTSNSITVNSRNFKPYFEVKMKFLIILIQIVCSRIAINVAFDLQPRIINGNPAHIGQFPYFALLEIELNENVFKRCGATLISDEWLLTAAHCVDNADRLVATLGISRLDSFFQAFIRTEVLIERDNIHIYPGYLSWALWNDIG